MADPHEEALENMLGVAQAAVTGMLVHMKPLMIDRIKGVLERNATIVDQRPEAIEHLADELFDEMYKVPGD